MGFSWDEAKNLANYRKHCVWFDEAKTIWLDANSTEYFDVIHSIHEERFIRLGVSKFLRVLIVIFSIDHTQENIRLISARKATASERLTYEEGI